MGIYSGKHRTVGRICPSKSVGVSYFTEGTEEGIPDSILRGSIGEYGLRLDNGLGIRVIIRERIRAGIRYSRIRESRIHEGKVG